MQDAEARALKRAVLVLVMVSSARWAWAQAAPPPLDGGGEDVLDALLEESVAEASELEARGRPLEPGERIDPNRADEVELDRLPGVGPATARAIVAAREEGHSFRRSEDLETVRGIGPSTAARLAPFLDLDRPPPASAAVRAPSSAPSTVDVNRATADELTALPGIGPALAGRIVDERRKQMFRSVEDLERVPGIGPATVERLRGHVRVSGGF